MCGCGGGCCNCQLRLYIRELLRGGLLPQSLVLLSQVLDEGVALFELAREHLSLLKPVLQYHTEREGWGESQLYALRYHRIFGVLCNLFRWLSFGWGCLDRRRNRGYQTCNRGQARNRICVKATHCFGAGAPLQDQKECRPAEAKLAPETVRCRS